MFQKRKLWHPCQSFNPNYALQIPKKEILSLILVYYTLQMYLDLSPKMWSWFLICFFGIWIRKGLPISPNLLCCRALEVPKYVYAPSASHLRQTQQLHNPGLFFPSLSLQAIIGKIGLPLFLDWLPENTLLYCCISGISAVRLWYGNRPHYRSKRFIGEKVLFPVRPKIYRQDISHIPSARW